jgi:septal ring factor EnvC (AmiA/AmiB activator)
VPPACATGFACARPQVDAAPLHAAELYRENVDMRGKFDRQGIQLSNLSESVSGYKAESAKQKEELASLHARNETLRRTQQNTAERANTLEQQLVTEQGQTKVLTRQLERLEAELADLHRANDECVAVAVDLPRGIVA